MSRKIYHLRMGVGNNLAKLLLLETLIRISARQDINPKFRANYRSQQKTGEYFTDAKTFQKEGFGDCGMAVVWGGALLRKKGIKAFPILQTRQTKAGRRLHTLLYRPKENLLIDPTFIVFRQYRKKGPSVIKPTPKETMNLMEQICKLHDAC